MAASASGGSGMAMRRRRRDNAAMNFRQIECFVQVAELGSFTRAAAVLGVAQPALSRQVRALEVLLRQPLFDQHRPGADGAAGGSLRGAPAQGHADDG